MKSSPASWLFCAAGWIAHADLVAAAARGYDHLIVAKPDLFTSSGATNYTPFNPISLRQDQDLTTTLKFDGLSLKQHGFNPAPASARLVKKQSAAATGASNLPFPPSPWFDIVSPLLRTAVGEKTALEDLTFVAPG